MITDWDDAYANGDYIADAATYPELWATQSAKFRDELSGDNRARIDITYGNAPAKNMIFSCQSARQKVWSYSCMVATGRRLINPVGRIWRMVP